jgi:hypothetical protein
MEDSQHKQDELGFPLHLAESYEPISINIDLDFLELVKAFLKKACQKSLF